MYTNYIFDLYGTLVDIKTDENSKYMWDKLNLFFNFNGAKYSSEELQKMYLYKVKNHAGQIKNTVYPDFEITNVFKELYKDKGINPSSELIKNTAQIFRVLSIKRLSLYDGVIELLTCLKENNKKIFLLSNAQRAFTMFELETLGIKRYFDDIFLSSDYEVCKPDYKFYHKLIDKYDLKVHESIMIGNDPFCDIKGASEVGLDTLYIKSNQSPKTKLESIEATFKLDYMQFKQISKLIINHV